MPTARRPLIASLLAACALLVACYTVPETGRTAINFMPDSQMASMASQQFAQMKQEMPISKDPKYNEQVQRVGQRIASVVGDSMPNAQWEFVVFDSEQINAFAMPGGHVGVYTGLLKLVHSDDELATVMGHEIGHVMARHSGERLTQTVMAEGGAIALAAYTETTEMSDDKKTALRAAYGLGATYGLLMPFSRKHESEADEIGLKIAARAGYDPRASVTFWQKMQAASGSGQPPEFLSTHPSHETRIEHLKELMPAAMEEYQKAQGVPINQPAP